MVDPQTAAKNWSAGLRNASEKIRQGIMGVTESPTAKAARAVDRMVLGIQRAAQEGRIQRGLMRVSLEDWKQAMISKGLPRVTGGATAAEPKMAAFLQEFLPHVEAGVRKLDSMPRGDLEQNLARMVEMARHNASFRRRAG